MTDADLEQRAINVIRGLSMDAVQRAENGHPGTPMALAPLAHVLFTRVMTYAASDPDWPDRDHFVLSAGHASMLLYSMLYLCGYGLELDDLRNFRQWGSRTPGHPERLHTRGVEVTTGPLGQGFANGIGMAIAEQHLRQRFGPEVSNHHVFAICSDGDLEEGISHESASLAGHLGLGRIVYVYDDNHITIDGPTELAYTDDVPKRFEAYGWHVVQLGEAANDCDALEGGLRAGMAEADRPTLVVLRSHIGWPSPKYTDSEFAHGNALGADEVAKVKEILGLPAEDFYAPDDVIELYRAAGRRGLVHRDEWRDRVKAWSTTNPERATEYEACLTGRGLDGWAAKLPTWQPGESIATRAASGKVLTEIYDVVPGLVGGGADLSGNTGTLVKSTTAMTTGDLSGRLIHFGVREHAMGSVMNGMAVSGTIPFGGTFFVFSDYMRPAARLAAIQQAKVAFVWTHDSIGVGPDGPTHQPVEQLAAIRAIPQLRVIRPADANEVAQAWRAHIDGAGPTAMILSRQSVSIVEGTAERAEAGVARGAYVLADEPDAKKLDLVLVGTGSEVEVCARARRALLDEGLSVRLVSMPSWDLFEAQPADARAEVLPPGAPTLAVEAASSFGWSRYADEVVSIDRFGASAPGDVVLERFGFTPEYVADRARALLGLADPPPPMPNEDVPA
ncbi:MAG TPA: transketolase [Acidimicrobiia bacterium]|nr:transketolase [Acidimicrobiia bacterium]